ncbi:hypothetical protein IW262DRAFT_1297903 [Armillaria fumosa]|nr:hypothetical protein IW262DRAFT_1297903 [Armillaria fumosa]
MAQAALPSDLTNDDIQYILEFSDALLNSTILEILMHGVTLWSIFRSPTKSISIGRYIMVLIVLALYILATVARGDDWAIIHYAFIDEGQNCYTIFLGLVGFGPMQTQNNQVLDVTGCISTIIADCSLIWRCWNVWSHQWLVIIIPVLCTILGTDCLDTSGL